MNVRVGDYFDMHKDGIPTKRVIVRDALKAHHKCLVEDIRTGNEYQVDMEYEMNYVIGNIFDK